MSFSSFVVPGRRSSPGSVVRRIALVAAGARPQSGPMRIVSLFRLYLLRALYLLLAVGLAFEIWPGILSHGPDWTVSRGTMHALLGTVGLLSVLGLRYPLQMLPLLLFELTWKVIWLSAFALPLVMAGRIDGNMLASIWACAAGLVLVPLALPWGYVIDRFVRAPGDRWR